MIDNIRQHRDTISEKLQANASFLLTTCYTPHPDRAVLEDLTSILNDFEQPPKVDPAGSVGVVPRVMSMPTQISEPVGFWYGINHVGSERYDTAGRVYIDSPLCYSLEIPLRFNRDRGTWDTGIVGRISFQLNMKTRTLELNQIQSGANAGIDKDIIQKYKDEDRERVQKNVHISSEVEILVGTVLVQLAKKHNLAIAILKPEANVHPEVRRRGDQYLNAIMLLESRSFQVDETYDSRYICFRLSHARD